MPKAKIDPLKLSNMLDEGKTPMECAQFFGVSKAAISQRMKSMKRAVIKSTAMERAPKVVDKNLNAIEQLQTINAHANEILDLMMRWQRGDEAAIQVLESQVKYVRINGSDEVVKEFKFKDPREIALKAMAEIRNQLKLQLEIFQMLYDTQAMKEFQEEVLTAIADAEPNVRDAIIRNLKDRRAVRATLQFA